MVIGNILGGLGNQMFQYAAGRALALRRNAILRLDISGFLSYRLHHGFELQRVFACPAEIASSLDVDRLLGWQSPFLVRRLMARPGLAAFRREAFVVEPHFHYWPEINNVPQDCYLVGYWQSEKYFQDMVSKIREDFTFRTPMSSRNERVAEKMARGNTVSLHVRRGDYAGNPKTKATHGLCSLEYYQAAIQYVFERVEQPHFFIVSDDMAWVKDNIKLDFSCEFIDHNEGAESYNDMRLMSLCQHHIIANSSFSWWGAWLGSRPDKIVVAPNKWFANDNITQDLYPQGWVKL